MAGALGIGALVAIVWAGHAAFKAFTKTGAETAKELENQIGKSQDYAMQLKDMNSHLERTSL